MSIVPPSRFSAEQLALARRLKEVYWSGGGWLAEPEELRLELLEKGCEVILRATGGAEGQAGALATEVLWGG